MSEPKNVIYGLYCVCESCAGREGIKYIGQSSRGARHRLNQHRYSARQGKPWVVTRWMAKHGPENIHCETLEVLESGEELDEAEARWITALDTLVDSGGYNIRAGGNSVRGYRHPEGSKTRVPRPMSEETKAKLRIASAANFGERSSSAKINNEMARKIKEELWAGQTIAQVVEKFGVGKGIVGSISNDSVWKHVPWPIGPRNRLNDRKYRPGQNAGEKSTSARFTENDVRTIRRLHQEGMGYAEIGRQYETSGTNIRMICNRVTWKNVD